MITENPNGSPQSVAETFEQYRADYDMSRENRYIRKRQGLPSKGEGADWHYRTEILFYRDIEKARDMARNDTIIGQTVERAVDNIIQGGFQLDPKTGDKKLDADLAARWAEESCDRDAMDVAGEFCFHDFEKISARSMIIDGDCINLGLDSGQLQHLEAHTIQTSTRQDNTVLGVTKDAFGKRLQYWVINDPIQPNESKERAKPVSVRNSAGLRTLFHVYNPKRMSQTRGVTAFAPIFSLAGMFEDIQFAKLVQAQVTSCFAIFRERQYLPDLPGTDTPGYGSAQSDETTTGGTRQIDNVAPGMEILGAPGEKLQGFSPSVPNAEYFSHVKLMIQMMGVNLGLPLVMVLMDGSETNFSGYRGAMSEARKGFRANQRNLKERFHTPYYRWKIAQWVAQDPAIRRAAKRKAVTVDGHNWNPPTWEYIEPTKDAQGDLLRLQGGLVSPRRLQAERGADALEIANETIEDNMLAIMAAKKGAEAVNKRYPEDSPVSWRDLLPRPMGAGVTQTLQDPLALQIQSDTQEAAAETAKVAAENPPTPKPTEGTPTDE